MRSLERSSLTEIHGRAIKVMHLTGECITMPTHKPRLTLALDEPIYAAISDLAVARAVSKAAVVRDFLEPAAPLFHRVAAVIRHAQMVQDDAARDFASTLELTEQMLMALLSEAEGAAADVDAGGARAAAADGSPGVPDDPRALTGGSDSRNPLILCERCPETPELDFSPCNAA